MKTNDSIKENNEMLNNKAQQLPEPPAEINVELPEDEAVYAITFLPWQFNAAAYDYAKNIMNTLRRNIGMFNIRATDTEEEESIIILTHKPSEELLKQIRKFAVDREIGIYGLLQILKVNTESSLHHVLKLITTNEL